MTDTSSNTHLEARYSSVLARLFFKSVFENQWVIQPPPPAWVLKVLGWYERSCMKVDLSGIDIDRPVFILSLPRCGSSMLQDVLCTHPDLAYMTNLMDICRDGSICAAEHFRRRFGMNIRGERFLKDSVLVDGGSPADPVATWADFFEEDYFDVNVEIPGAAEVSDELRDRVQQRVKEVLWTFGLPPRRFFCKTPMLLPYASALKGIFPDAKFIHLLRDPRQGVNSMLKIHRICNEQLRAIHARRGKPAPEREFVPYPRLPKLAEYLERYGSNDLRTTAHLWNDAIDYIDSVRGFLGDDLYELTYESICADPRGALEGLWDFCELNTDAGRNQALDAKIAGVGVIHHRNDYHDFEQIETICGDRMSRYGYF